MATMGSLPLETQFGCRNPLTSLLDYLNRLVCSRMQTRRWQLFVFRGRLERARQKRSMPNTNHRRRPPMVSVVEWTVKFAAPALQLDPIKVIWSRSTTFFGPLFSTRHCDWSSRCDLSCNRVDSRGYVPLSSTKLHRQSEHQVGSKTAFCWSPPTGSCSDPKQRVHPPPEMREMWNADGSWHPLRKAPTYPTLPGGVGQKKATWSRWGCTECPHKDVHGLWGRSGEGTGIQISGAVGIIRWQWFPGHAVEPEESAQELGTGITCVEGREHFT